MVFMSSGKYNRFFLDTQAEEFMKCFDENWVKEVAEAEKKQENEVWKEMKDQIKGVTCHLRLGEEAFTSGNKAPINLKEKGYMEIEPGETALLITYEKVKMPENRMGFLSLRTTHASKGLINISGFHIDPNFNGKLVFSVYNSSPRPVVLKYKEFIYHMFVVQLSNNVKWKEPSFQGTESLRSDWIGAIKGPPVSLQGLYSNQEKLRTKVNILITILVATFATLLGYLIFFFLTKGGGS